MKYSQIISSMTWSYSRLRTYEMCPYKFFLTYICADTKQEKLFYSEYGLIVHEIIADYYTKGLTRNEMVSIFTRRYLDEVSEKAPTSEIRVNFFTQGVSFFKHGKFPDGEVIAVEKHVDFDIGGRRFTGFIDLVLKNADGDMEIWDHKSHKLKHGKRKQKTKADDEIDKYLVQLYLYSHAIAQSGMEKNLKSLCFNCYRSQTHLKEPFDIVKYREAERWATDTINRILNTEEWLPNVEPFVCRNLCDVHEQCEYYQMCGGK